MDLLPPDRGWVIARDATHAVLFLTPDGRWSDDHADAKVLCSMLQAQHHQRRHSGSSILSLTMLSHMMPPTIRVVRRPVATR